MTQKVLGMVTIPCVGGRVIVSSSGTLSISYDDEHGTAGRARVELDEVAALKIAEALTVLVVEMMTKAKAKTRPPTCEPCKACDGAGCDQCGGSGAEADNAGF